MSMTRFLFAGFLLSASIGAGVATLRPHASEPSLTLSEASTLNSLPSEPALPLPAPPEVPSPSGTLPPPESASYNLTIDNCNEIPSGAALQFAPRDLNTIAYLPRGAVVTVTGNRDANWVEVTRGDGVTGWIVDCFL
ncbi:MAG: SH3 domain-containing protein [Cyanobacteria bacterium J06638_22]